MLGSMYNLLTQFFKIIIHHKMKSSLNGKEDERYMGHVARKGKRNADRLLMESQRERHL